MRIIVIFIILIFIASALYTGYGILTFEPEKPAPLVFKEPTPESLKALGVLPVQEPASIPMTPEQQDQTQKAVAKISEAITAYQALENAAPLRLKGTLETIDGMMASGRLPAYFLSVKDAARPARKFELLSFNPKQVSEASASAATLSCDDTTSVLLGNDGEDSLSCAAANKGGDRIFIGGPGNDKITDAPGNRIVNPGGGDDTITLGPGRSIIVLDESWGHDNVSVDCRGADIATADIPKGFPVPWASPYTNFIVLNPRISRSSIKWVGNVLTNTETGDTLAVNQKCFTLVN